MSGRCELCKYRNYLAREEPCNACYMGEHFLHKDKTDILTIDYEELKRLIVREAPHANDCHVWVNDKGNVEKCSCWKIKAFKLLGVEVNNA